MRPVLTVSGHTTIPAIDSSSAQCTLGAALQRSHPLGHRDHSKWTLVRTTNGESGLVHLK